MTTATPIWMATYWHDYARDTPHFNATLHGAYLMLIKHYWCSGEPLIDDDESLWRLACCDGLAQWRKLRPKIEPMFQVADGLWRHKRVEQELGEAAERIAKKSRAGKKGANKRWGNG